MRVIAGELKGRNFQAVPGRKTRPTTDRVREAWASSVNSIAAEGFVGIRVLDAFAGSGALGIEALSRGAELSIFVDADKQAATTISANLAQLGLDLPSKSQIVARDIFAPASLKQIALHKPYTLVILDPPYDTSQGRILTLLNGLARLGALQVGTIISYEQRCGTEDCFDGHSFGSACSPLSLEMVSCKTYGTSQIRYYVCR
jgi:16S rRNA (guanine966-N2)-methyltransferase